jgi:hypothetical protein
MDVVELLLYPEQSGRPQPGEQQAMRIDVKSGGADGTIIGSTTPVMLTYQGWVQRFPQQFSFETPLVLTPSGAYYFEVVPVSGKDIFAPEAFQLGAYADGNLIAFGRPQGTYDLWFRTGTLVPEPSTGALLVLGGLGLCWAARRRHGV